MRILVIGSEGNVGRVLYSYLEQCGHIITRTDVVPKVDHGYYQADINIPIDILRIFKAIAPEVVFLLAGQVSRVLCELSGGLAINTNISGVYNIIELCKIFGSKLIFMSSSEVYGNQDCVLDEDTTSPQPNNRYGLTKLIGEQLIKYEVEQGLKAVILRPFMMYHESETRGNHRSAIIRFVEALIERQPITIHEKTGRCWLYLGDAVKAMEKAVYLDRFDIINIGTDHLITTDYLAHLIADKIGIDLADYAVYEDLPDKMTRVKIPAIDKMVNILGYKSETNIDEGLDKIIKSFRSENANNILYNSSI